jgi:hypothetical protein
MPALVSSASRVSASRASPLYARMKSLDILLMETTRGLPTWVKLTYSSNCNVVSGLYTTLRTSHPRPTNAKKPVTPGRR